MTRVLVIPSRVLVGFSRQPVVLGSLKFGCGRHCFRWLRLVCRCRLIVSWKPWILRSSPWRQGVSQIGLFYLPIVLEEWSPHVASRAPYLIQPSADNPQSEHDETRRRRIGLVWSAGRHKAPQPERNARVRDVPREAFFELAQMWRQRHQVTLVSMQLGRP